jgi:hypothetical protein
MPLRHKMKFLVTFILLCFRMMHLKLYSKLYDILLNQLALSEKNVLKEDGNQALCTEVRLKSDSSQYSTYKFDGVVPGIKDIFPFFSQSNSSHRQICDYLVFYSNNSKLSVFIFNMKSKNMSNSHRQVINGFIFSKFLVEMASSCLNLEAIPDCVEYKAVHFLAEGGKQRMATNPRNLKFERYGNGLRYLVKSCKQICSLDELSKIE